MRSIIDWLMLLCAINAAGFLSLLALVAYFFHQHDRDLRAEVVRLRESVDKFFGEF